jgi:putative FmdB family regulatory protein
MPIYAYKCGACGFAKDVLQKISDAPLTVCPECGASAYSKQVTAAGFQLKGSGWYVTDFRNNGTGNGSAAPAAKKDEGASGSDAAPAAKTETKSEAPAPAAAPATPAPAATPAAS